jgi:hypothetical protein
VGWGIVAGILLFLCLQKILEISNPESNAAQKELDNKYARAPPEMEITMNKNLLSFKSILHSLWIFLPEIIKIWQKSWNYWFADFFLKFLKSIGWYGFSYGFLVVFESVLSMFCLKLLLISVIFIFDKLSFIKDYLRKHICIIGWSLCAQEIHRLGSID